MAIALDSTASGSSAGSSTSHTHTVVAGSGTNRVLVAIVTLYGANTTNSDISSITCGGTNMTRIFDIPSTTGENVRVHAYYIPDASLGAAGAKTVAVSTSSGVNTLTNTICLTGASQTVTVYASTASGTPILSMSTSITATAGDCLIEGTATQTTVTTNYTPGAGQTALATDNLQGTASYELGVSAGSNSQSETFDNYSFRTAQLVVAVSAGGEAVTTTTNYSLLLGFSC